MIEKKQDIILKMQEISTLLYKRYTIDRTSSSMSLSDCCEIKTGKLNAEASNSVGKYPFFTCGRENLLIDSFSFEGKNIVVAGNGDISVKYYDGKCNAYQRTYMLAPKKHIFLFLKECELSINDLKSNSQGSVIKFITKNMLENISIPINEYADDINSKIGVIHDSIQRKENEMLKLRIIKAQLLSKYF